MIPILYEKNERAFISNGLGRLYECISCIVTEERNGIYECDFEYPVNGDKFGIIVPGRIVAIEHDDSHDVQPFDIISCSKPINGVVTFHAVHISYRQKYITVTGKNINSLAAAFGKLKQGVPSNPFEYETDKSGETGFVAAFDGVPRSARQLLGGIEGSILDTYHGEYEFDKFRVILHENRGTNKSLTIRYGVNMIEFNDSTDYSEAYTSCVPFWTGDDGISGTAVVVGSKINSGLISYSDRDECVPFDLTEKFENKPTAAQLTNMARNMMASSKSNQPNRTITVSFVRLQESSEYRQLAPLMECRLCDKVRVVFPKYNVEEYFKIVKTEYDVLAERYKSMELGNLSSTLSSVLGASGDSPLPNQPPSGQDINVGLVNGVDMSKVLQTGQNITVGTVNGINISQLSRLITTKEFSVTYSVAASSNATGTLNVALSGYTPVAVAGYASGDYRVFPYNLTLSGNTLTYRLRNTHTAAQSNLSFKPIILYVGSGFKN